MTNAFTDLNSLYLYLQLSILALFAIAMYRAARGDRARAFELIIAFIFGLLLEEGDILTFKTYHYDSHWFLLDQVPPAIALCWALIIASAMNFSDALGIDERLAPLADAFWAILLDLSLDAVAIRLGFWTWTTTPITAGWFGVPWGNFYSWLGVAASFSFFTRWVRRRAATRGPKHSLWQTIVPLVAYGGLLLSIFPYALLNNLYFRRAGLEWIVFAVPFAAIALVTLRAMTHPAPVRDSPDVYLTTVRYLIHGYFLWAVIAAGIAARVPFLLYISLAMVALETGLVVYLAHVNKRRAIAMA